MIDDIIKDCAQFFAATGSNYICNPPVTNTDKDYIILPNDGKFTNLIESLKAYNWKFSTGYEDSDFISLKKQCGETLINLIIVKTKIQFDAYVYATKIAKALNLREKEDRIALFEIVKRTYPIRNKINVNNDPFANYKMSNDESDDVDIL